MGARKKETSGGLQEQGTMAGLRLWRDLSQNKGMEYEWKAFLEVLKPEQSISGELEPSTRAVEHPEEQLRAGTREKWIDFRWYWDL